jgi:hypothetical protein
MTWLIDKKEKVFIIFLLLSTQFSALTPGRLDISDFAVLVVLFLWLIYVFMNREYKIIWSPLYILMLFFLLSVLLSILNGGITSLFRLPGVIKAIILFFILVNIIRDRKIAIFSLKIFLLIITFSAIIGIAQEVIFLLTGHLLIGFIPEDIVRLFIWQTTPFGVFIRVPAFTGWYTILSNFLLTALIVGVNLILYSVLIEKKERLSLFIAIPLFCIALYLTFSYSAMLTVLLAIIVSILIRWRSLSIHFVTIFLVGILLAYFSGFIPDFIDELKNYIITEDVRVRINLLRDGIAGFFNRHPFIGNGIGTGLRYTGNVVGWSVHNNVVLVADELGLFGIFTYGTLFFVFIFRQVTSILKLKNKKDKAVSLSLLIALIAYMTNLQAQSQYVDFFLFTFLGLTEAIINTLSYQVPLESNSKS